MLEENVNAPENREQFVADGSLPTHVFCSLAFLKTFIIFSKYLR